MSNPNYFSHDSVTPLDCGIFVLFEFTGVDQTEVWIVTIFSVIASNSEL